jgi:hypothetical protein
VIKCLAGCFAYNIQVFKEKLFYCRFLFNDAEVKQFDPTQIATECFGGEMTVS